jgi:hypothetical protein
MWYWMTLADALWSLCKEGPGTLSFGRMPCDCYCYIQYQSSFFFFFFFFFFLTSYARFWSFLYFSVVIILNNVFWCVWREKYRMRYSIFHKHKSIVKATSGNGIPWSPRSLACMMDNPLCLTIFLAGFFLFTHCFVHYGLCWTNEGVSLGKN